MKKFINTAKKSSALFTLGLLLLLWEKGVSWYEIPAYILPAPTQILDGLLKHHQLLIYHTSTTLLEAVAGLSLAVILALIIGFLLHNLRVLYTAVYPLLVFSQTIPLIVLAVLLPLWFGWGMLPKIIIIVLVCFFPIVISFLNGLDLVDPDQINLFRSMGATKWATFKMVKLPTALPAFFSGLRISATYSIMAAVISEWVGAQRGLGYYMTLQQKSFAIDQVLGAVVVICVLSFIMVKIVDLLNFLLMPWNRNQLVR